MAGKTALLCLVSCFGLTLYAAFWWKSFCLSLLFYIMQFISFIGLDSQFKPYPRSAGYALCCVIGNICMFLGVFLLLLPGYGLNLFTIFYSVGIICTMGSIVFAFLEMMLHKIIQIAANAVYEALTRYIQRQSDWLQSEVQTFVLELRTLLLSLNNLTLFFSDVLENFFKFGFFLGLTKISSDQSQNTPFNEPQMKTDAGTQPLENVDYTEQEVPLKQDKQYVKVDFLFMVIRWWFSYIIHFAGFFILGAGCTIVGVWLWYVPNFRLTPFIVFYTAGNLCIMMSTWFLKSPADQLEMMFDDTRGESSACMIICFVLTQLMLFWWESFILTLVFSVLYILSTFWYAALKLLSYNSTAQNDI